MVDELKRRAAEGEAAASCRLAAEYLHCSHLPSRRAAMDRWLAQQHRTLGLVDAQVDKQMISQRIDREMTLRQEGVDRIASHCKGVAVPDAAGMVKLWRRSALAGNPAAMKQYSSGNAFRWSNTMETLPELATYKQEGERIATVASQRGDFDMLLALAAGYMTSNDGSRPLIAQLLKPDGARSLALYRHIDAALVRAGNSQERVGREVRDRIESLELTLSREELVRADAITRTELNRWNAPTIRGVHALDASGRQRDIDRDWCGR